MSAMEIYRQFGFPDSHCGELSRSLVGSLRKSLAQPRRRNG